MITYQVLTHTRIEFATNLLETLLHEAACAIYRAAVGLSHFFSAAYQVHGRDCPI
jgi:hypothetical protein